MKNKHITKNPFNNGPGLLVGRQEDGWVGWHVGGWLGRQVVMQVGGWIVRQVACRQVEGYVRRQACMQMDGYVGRQHVDRWIVGSHVGGWVGAWQPLKVMQSIMQILARMKTLSRDYSRSVGAESAECDIKSKFSSFIIHLFLSLSTYLQLKILHKNNNIKLVTEFLLKDVDLSDLSLKATRTPVLQR